MKYINSINYDFGRVYNLASSVVNNVVVAPVKTAVNVVTGGVTATVNTATNVVSTVTGGITSGIKATVGAFSSLSSGTVVPEATGAIDGVSSSDKVTPGILDEIKGMVGDIAALGTDTTKFGHHAISAGYVIGLTAMVWFFGAGAITTAAMFGQSFTIPIVGTISAKAILGGITSEYAPYVLGAAVTAITSPSIYEALKDGVHIIKDSASILAHTGKVVGLTVDNIFTGIYDKLIKTEDPASVIDPESQQTNKLENKDAEQIIAEEKITDIMKEDEGDFYDSQSLIDQLNAVKEIQNCNADSNLLGDYAPEFTSFPPIEA